LFEKAEGEEYGEIGKPVHLINNNNYELEDLLDNWDIDDEIENEQVIVESPSRDKREPDIALPPIYAEDQEAEEKKDLEIEKRGELIVNDEEEEKGKEKGEEKEEEEEEEKEKGKEVPAECYVVKIPIAEKGEEKGKGEEKEVPVNYYVDEITGEAVVSKVTDWAI